MDARRKGPDRLKHILFVCSGNTCRSPLAEGIARSLLVGGDGLSVSSAGTSAVEGLPASVHSAEVARQHGIDLSGHRSRLLCGQLVREVDLIVAMGKGHIETVAAIAPSALAYTCRLTEFSEDLDGDIDDPIGGDIAIYGRTYFNMLDGIEAMLARLDRFDGWKKG
jgi:protein-tyrosine-phosphatase